MEALYMEGTQETPKVNFNKSDGMFELSGRSLPEDAVEFYGPVIKWIKSYATAPNEVTVFKFKLDYFNTASSKLVHEILNLLKDIQGIQIEWHYLEDDEDILEAGKEFEEQMSISFAFKLL